jgi:UDP-N-acetylglucosamine 2-epimerase
MIAEYFPSDILIENLDFNLVTIHREENTRDSFILIDLLDKINRSKFKSIFPIHPRTLNLIKKELNMFENIIFIKPVGYIDMLTLIKHCRKVVTDSGGVLREAYFSNKPTITIRSSIEIKETLINKANILCRNDSKELVYFIDFNLESNVNRFIPFFGDGNASKIIVDEISDFLGQVKGFEQT